MDADRTSLSGAEAAKQRRRCVVDGCDHAAVSNSRCRSHGGPYCSVHDCVNGVQSRGLCIVHGRCGMEGCSNSALVNGFCRQHGEGVKCRYPGCTNWAQKGGMCSKHIDRNGNQEDGINATDNGAARHVDLTTEEHEDTPRESVEAEAAPSETTATAVRCHIEGCFAVVERNGFCHFHSVKQRCNYLGGCRNIAHQTSLFCLAHLAYGDSRLLRTSNDIHHAPPAAHSSSLRFEPAVMERNAPVEITARRQEMQARQSCDAILSVRSAELFAILGNDTATESISDASSMPTIQTTAREQQRIAERFCNEVLAARAYHFMRTNPAQPARPASERGRPQSSDLVMECNIRGCRNLTSGRRPLCTAHESWATGQF